MKRDCNIDLVARWDRDVVPAGERSRRGLLVDIQTEARRGMERPPMNLGLVIDRSGSMSGDRIETAKRAAQEVVERLGNRDVVSVVAFDDKLVTIARGVQLDQRGKREALHAIGGLQSGGTTNLAGGWLRGAECVAQVMERMAFPSGHLVVLSDGHANVGIQDPRALRGHADNMASRGVTTSAVGVGNGYSPLQLEALCDGGLGRLHDAATPHEMMETLLGEFNDVSDIVARDVQLDVSWPRGTVCELLADYEATGETRSISVRLGQLLGGSRRTLPFLFDVEALSEGRMLPVEISLTGRHSETEAKLSPVCATTTLHVVSAQEAENTPRDLDVASHISMMWGRTAGLEAMRANEAGDYDGAVAMMLDVSPDLAGFSKGTASEDVLAREMRDLQSKVSDNWGGRSKRDAMSAARKFSKSERDHRSSRRGDRPAAP